MSRDLYQPLARPAAPPPGFFNSAPIWSLYGLMSRISGGIFSASYVREACRDRHPKIYTAGYTGPPCRYIQIEISGQSSRQQRPRNPPAVREPMVCVLYANHHPLLGREARENFTALWGPQPTGRPSSVIPESALRRTVQYALLACASNAGSDARPGFSLTHDTETFPIGLKLHVEAAHDGPFSPLARRLGSACRFSLARSPFWQCWPSWAAGTVDHHLRPNSSGPWRLACVWLRDVQSPPGTWYELSSLGACPGGM